MTKTQEVESVVFYAWIENQPSSVAIAVQGGGMKSGEPLKQVRFTKGRLETTDAEAIALLRRLIVEGDNITENHEVFLSKTTTREEQKDRIAKQNEELLKENERLRKQLGKKASAAALVIAALLLMLGRPVLAITDPAVVQHKSAENASSVNNITVTSTSNVTTNNYSVVSCAWFANGITASVTDPAGNTYTDTGAGAATNTTGPGWIQTFKAKITAGGGATLTPKCNYSSATTFVNIIWHEISGLDGTTAVDSFGNNSPNPAANAWTVTASATATAANVLVYSVCAPQHTIVNAAGPSYTATEFTSDAVLSEYAIIHAAGAHTPTLKTGTNADNWACNTVNFKSADQTAATAVSLNNFVPVRADAGTSATTWSGNYSVGTDSNRLLVVRLYYNGSADTNSPPTYNSVSMTRVNLTCDDHATQVCQDTYRLLSPATGSNTLSVTFSSARFGYMIAKDFGNVNQTTPIASIQTENVQTINPSNVTVTSATGDWVDTGNVVNAKVSCPSSSTGLDFAPATSGDPEMFEGHAAGAASVTMGWTQITGSTCPGTSGNAVHAQVAFDIQAATAPARIYTRKRIM